MEIATYPDIATLSQQAAQYIVRLANEAIVTRGRFTIALSGGSSAKAVYPLLASEPYRSQVNWEHVAFFWGDERCVPPDDPESNYHLAQEALLSKITLHAGQVHRMPADQADREAASDAYTQEMQQAFGTNGIPAFDLIHLGMGPEGHTASLFPHQASLHEHHRLVIPVTTPKPPPDRLTFTPPVLNAAKHVLFIVTGADKADAVYEVLDGEEQPEEYPAQLIRRNKGEVVWMLDGAAMGRVKG